MKKKYVFSIFILFVFLIACSNSSDIKKTKKNKTLTVKKETDGAAIYKKFCVQCHGVGGDIGTNGSEDLTKLATGLESRILIVKKGRGAMTPFAGVLSDEEIHAVARYTMTLNKDL